MSDIQYIDIHAHINFPQYDEDREAVIRRAHEKGVAIIGIGTSIQTSEDILSMINKYESIHPHIYAIPGIHPLRVIEHFNELVKERKGNSLEHTIEENEMHEIAQIIAEQIDNDLNSLKALMKFPKVVGVGECGIDVYRVEPVCRPVMLELQKKLFIGQIQIALDNNIPLMIHARESYSEILSILDENFIDKGIELKGNVHFFAGSSEEARAFLDRGFTVSFTGVITFADSYEETIRSTPLDKLMSETDCPFVTPVPYRGGRNEPVYVIEVLKKLAQIKGISEQEMQNAVISTAERVFGLNLRPCLE